MNELTQAVLDRRIIGTETEYQIGFKIESENNNTQLPDKKIVDLYSNLPFELRACNTFLTNGARLYSDIHDGPEYATPEARSAREAVAAEIAGEIIVASVYQTEAPDLAVFKNLAGHTTTTGHHENYGVSKDIKFFNYCDNAMSHFISRVVFNGAGTMRFSNITKSPEFALGQKAWSIRHLISNGTTREDKGLVNSRGDIIESHGKYPRLHVTGGDANISEWAMWYSLISTSAVLALTERGVNMKDLMPLAPIPTIKRFAGDTTLKKKVTVESGRNYSALDIQEIIIERIAKHLVEDSDNPEFRELVREGQKACDDARKDVSLLADRVDWVAKKEIIARYFERKNLPMYSPREFKNARALDILYTRLDGGIGIKLRALSESRHMVDRLDIDRLCSAPPTDTRAAKRAREIERILDQQTAEKIDWSRIIIPGGNIMISDMDNPYEADEVLV